MWKELFNMQEVLDNKIHADKGLTREETFHKRILALLVEVGEMMNEHRSFKYWSEDQEPRTNVKANIESVNPIKSKNLLLEEYVDCIHFLLSIGNDLGIQEVKYIEPQLQKDLTGQVIDLYNMISILQVEQKHREK